MMRKVKSSNRILNSNHNRKSQEGKQMNSYSFASLHDENPIYHEIARDEGENTFNSHLSQIIGK